MKVVVEILGYEPKDGAVVGLRKRLAEVFEDASYRADVEVLVTHSTWGTLGGISCSKAGLRVWTDRHFEDVEARLSTLGLDMMFPYLDHYTTKLDSKTVTPAKNLDIRPGETL
jgi:hypothetical protein